ncbi:MAG: beta-glucosidase BglX [Bacteroidales bacterium]|nr:beta-glucosidase BglX [Bacteroidales bacterium]MCF8344028.1 beta-glucosidase BglX [Bacteroidales bacterium]MCF8350042.1 beta-glucosidase BglX [Bacteroidales bacterium]MCF8375198.1 beta-glucosidase BglX [Bacteroidales bacterium]MCF8400680.1 beta-glucosidase BglX [Bacteroidales bacterium]
MSLEDKIGQLQLMNSPGNDQLEELEERIRKGRIGGVLNEVRPEVIQKMQLIAVEESELGIPLLFGRDVIHGFKTVLPINIGMAATFNPGLIRKGALVSAKEASSVGINWNFAPMIDIARDPRWGRMAESFGEDPLLVTRMGLAMMRGFHGNDPDKEYLMAACAKHFAGYGAAEGGRDYNSASIPEVELWNVYFPPFKALKDAGVHTFMTGFNELNGVPASGNAFLLRNILKERWDFKGFVVSDWASITEMQTHGFVANEREAARKSMQAGLDMEMATSTYCNHLKEMVESCEISEDLIDDAVRRILRIKLQLDLFEYPYANPEEVINNPPDSHFNIARKIAEQSFVLLKNKNQTLPLNKNIKKLAVIGPMADDRYEQLGTWIFDGDTNLSITPLLALKNMLGRDRINYAKALETMRSLDKEGFPGALQAAVNSEAIIVFAGEESIITGEAHSRAYLDLPGAQNDLVKELSKTGKPLILVVMTARPLTIGEIQQYADAVIYAWHPGTMAGPALADVLFGVKSPSGKLPVTFPKAPGQIPVYYAHKNTGRPPSDESFTHIQDIPVRSFQTSIGNTSHYLDVGFKPLYPFGFGLSYTSFEYSNLILEKNRLNNDDSLKVSIDLANTGIYMGTEVVQIYIRDMVASITRPVKELKDFKRISIDPGKKVSVHFTLPVSELGFFDAKGNYKVEPGKFRVWIGGSSDSGLSEDFLLENE